MNQIAGWITDSVADPEPGDFPLSHYPTDQAEDIIERLVPEWARLFLVKNNAYGRVDNHLGPAGVFPDINRKTGRLERDLWDKEPVAPGMESTRRVILDLIGHLFLALHMLDDEELAEMATKYSRGDVHDAVAEEIALGETTPDDLESVMEALRRVLAGSPITPEQGASIKRFIAERPDPDRPDTGVDLPGGISYAEHGMPSPSTRHLYEKQTVISLPATLGADGRVTPVSDRALDLWRGTIAAQSKLPDAPTSDGWDTLPKPIQDIIRLLAEGYEAAPDAETRSAASQYLSDVGQDGP